MTHPVSAPADRPSARRRAALAAVAAAAALGIGGCAEPSLTPLPELGSVPRQVLSNEEQQKAIDELIAKNQTHQAEAVKQIEQEKGR
jgi:hypothetical protein